MRCRSHSRRRLRLAAGGEVTQAIRCTRTRWHWGLHRWHIHWWA